MTTERRRGFMRVAEHQAEELERWAYPDYADENPQVTDNALNYDPQWHSQPMEEEEEQGPPPLTAADLEEIRQSAYEEGLAEGREAGLVQGLEQGTAQGLEQGLAQGLEQGLAQGLEQGQQRIDEQVGFLTQLVEKMANPLQQVDSAVEEQVIQMVTSLARELIRVEVQTNPQVILNTVREVVATLPVAGQQITLSLHPDDLALVKDAYGEDNLAERKWSLQAEPAMSRGDLQVHSGDSSVDYQLEERIRHLLKQFSGINSQLPAGGQ
ncbi:flagellar assembly protein FliH [Photobacterium sanctipauli]|uniref:Flagellar assembly protein FliH n=1 Tax=Photobacterium sanctipauli TaxID=1342794 RepID=A0A2T3NTF3_9GAMM|nr:flagellar assembly protein FliH [Photobacterium sanctipauli]PSW19542.1 flagellar assembly protein FliH [Photobacterium sanctipauli]